MANATADERQTAEERLLHTALGWRTYAGRGVDYEFEDAVRHAALAWVVEELEAVLEPARVGYSSPIKAACRCHKDVDPVGIHVRVATLRERMQP